MEGLRGSLTIALEYALNAIEHGEERSPEVPLGLLTQARMAARNGVSLDTVLRRYFTGYALLSEFILEEADASGLMGGSVLRPVLRGQAAVFDRLIEMISEEHGRETASRMSADRRRADRVRRLLRGEFIGTGDLRYDLDGFHLAIIALGAEATARIRELASLLDMRCLLVDAGEDQTWAWLGSTGGRLETADADRLFELIQELVPADVALACGEPGEGPDGWRLSHRQAAAALPILLRGAQRVVRYSDVALVASITADDVLTATLRRLYLDPLDDTEQGGEALRQTLRDYLRSGYNISCTAAALGLNRETVRKRLRMIEQRIGRSLNNCAVELEAALRLEEEPPR